MADKYGFFRLLLQQYYRFGRTAYDYVTQIYYAPDETRAKYAEELKPISYRAVAWCIQSGYMSLSDFASLPTAKLAKFTYNVKRFAELFDYGQYYHLAKSAYLATPELLQTITPPEALADIEARGYTDYVTDFCHDCDEGLKKAAKLYTTPADIDKTPQEQEQAREQAQTITPLGEREFYKISQTLNNINQRPIEASAMPTPVYNTDTLPIKNFIEAFLITPKNQIYNNGLLTEDMLQRVISGLNYTRNKPTLYNTPFSTIRKNDNIYYLFNVNISEFAENCGFRDANQQEKLALFGSLMLLQNVYLRTTLPYRVRETKRGKTYHVGGERYVQVVNIPNYELDGNNIPSNFTIEITARDLGGELMPITTETLRMLGEQAKGASERRFQAQLLGKDNKNENDLIDEVFGYDVMLKYAKPEELKDIKAYIRKHRNWARNKIQTWFDKYLQTGFLLSYTRTQNKAGVWVYKWERESPKALPEPTNEPIQDAEIVQDEQPKGEQ